MHGGSEEHDEPPTTISAARPDLLGDLLHEHHRDHRLPRTRVQHGDRVLPHRHLENRYLVADPPKTPTTQNPKSKTRAIASQLENVGENPKKNKRTSRERIEKTFSVRIVGALASASSSSPPRNPTPPRAETPEASSTGL